MLNPFETVARHVRRADSDWWRHNSTRRSEGYGRTRLWLGRRLERPKALPVLLSGLVTVLSFLAALPVSPELERFLPSRLPEDVVGYFSTLWSIQAAVAALVYPIVIAFVTILLQRRHGAKASLHIYLYDSGAISAGLSALFMIGVMTAQYVAIPHVWSSTVVAWVGFDAVWFVINLVMTGYFLLRTFDFLILEKRKQIIRRFTIGLAWPAEVRFLLAAHMFRTSVSSGLLPGPAYGTEQGRNAPSVLLFNMGRDFGEVAVWCKHPRQVFVKTIRLGLLRFVVTRWLARASEETRSPDDDPPVINFPAITGDRCAPPGLSLCTIRGVTKLTSLERTLVRLSYGFSTIDREAPVLTVEEIFREILIEARGAMELGDEEEFTDRIREFSNLYRTLIATSVIEVPGSDRDNFVHLADRRGFFERPTYEAWNRQLLDLGQAAALRIASSNRYVVSLAYAAAVILDEAVRSGGSSMAVECIRVPSALFHYMGNWWTKQLEAEGVHKHGICETAVLQPPFRNAYEQATSGMIGAWESLKNDHFPPISDTPSWVEFGESVGCYDQHLLETGVNLVAAVDRGDEVGAEWLTNSFSHWYSQLEQRFDAGSGSLRDESVVHLGLFEDEWETVRALLNVEEANVFGVSGVRLVFASALKNLGDDRAVMVCAVLVVWGRDCECDSYLPARLVKALMFGAAAVGGSERIRSMDSLQSADALLISIVRQQFSPGSSGALYGRRADAAAAAIFGIRRSLMVPGRIYTGSGRGGLDTFADGFLVLLAVLAPNAWVAPVLLSERIRSLVGEDNQMFQRLIRGVQSWVDRIRSDEFEAYAPIYQCLSTPQDGPRDFTAARATVANALETLLRQSQVEEQDAIASEPIDDGRLRELGRWASEQAFSREAGRFPLPLFEVVDSTPLTLQEYTLVLQAMEKGRFTVRALAQRSANEHEWLVKTFRDHVAVTVLRDRIFSMKPETRSVADPVEYWKVISQFAKNQEVHGRETILIVSGIRAPEWLRDWVGEGRDTTSVPPDLTFTKRSECKHLDGYIGHFNEIGVFRAPVERGVSYVIARDAFDSVTFTRRDDGAYVWATPVAVEGRPTLVDMRMSWARDVPAPRDGGALRIEVSGPTSV